MRGKKGFIQFLAGGLGIAIIIALIIWLNWDNITNKEEDNPITITTTTIIAQKIIEYKALNRSCIVNANCTSYYGNLGLDLNTTCRNNICNQIIIR